MKIITSLLLSFFSYFSVAQNNLDFANNLIVRSTTPWADSQFGGSGCWQEAGQWFSQDLSNLGLANIANDLYWPVAGSVVIDQVTSVSPHITTDLMGRPRITNDPCAFAAQQ